MPLRKAEAKWEGGLKDGNGVMKLGGGAYHGAYSWKSRFDEGTGTNPEELIGAAHAGCFSMALSGQLTNAGFVPERISTKATVKLEKTEAGFTVTSVHLDVIAKVPNASQDDFVTAANNAKSGCPISRLLNATITMDAKLED